MFSDPLGLRAGPPPVIDPAVLRLLRGCVAELEPSRAEVVLALHQRLLELTPVATVRLPGNGRPLCQRIVDALLRAGDGTMSPAQAADLALRVGEENEADRFPSDQYGTITHAILHALRGTYPGEWSSALSSGWVEFLLWFRSNLLVGAERQRAAEAGPAGDGSFPGPGGSFPAPVFPAPAFPAPAFPAPAFPALGGSAGREGPPVDDDDDEDEPAYGHLMVSMTLNPKRDKRRG